MLSKLRDLLRGEQYMLTGSRIIAPGSVTPESDLDVMVLTKRPAELESRLYPLTTSLVRGYGDSGLINSLKLHPDATGTDYPVNILIVSDPEYFGRWEACTAIAQHLKLTSKEDRAALFRVGCGD